MSRDGANLTIGAVAAATDVGIPVLRSWEQRHGFPVPERLPSGHRRYSTRQVEQIRQVVRDRDAGMSLDAAIARVRVDERADPSIFAGLCHRWPELPVHVLSKRAMLAISRAIEDECCARAERPLLVGAFQRERFWRASERRWRELARTASAVIVFGDFATRRRASSEVVRVTITPDAPLLREWAVVCDAADAAACLAGRERLTGDAEAGRRFEAVWSVDPLVVRDAADIGVGLAGAAAPDRSTSPRRPLADQATALRRATAVTNRIVAYLDAG